MPRDISSRSTDNIFYIDSIIGRNEFIYFGNSRSPVPRIVSGNRMIFGKINSNGDSITSLNTDDLLNNPQVCKVNIPTTAYWVSGSGYESYYHFIKFDINGNRLRRFVIAPDSVSDTFENVYGLIGLSDGGFIAIGNLQKIVGTRLPYVEHVARYDSNGRRIWWKSFLNPYGYSFVNRIEPTNRGTFIISGSDGPDIYIHEIDSTGYPISRRVLYTHPQRYGWYDAKVWQHPGGYVVIGYDASNNTSNRFIASFYDLSFNRIWGKLGNFIINSITVQSDGTFWAIRRNFNNNYVYYTKFRTDSTAIDSILLSTPTTTPSGAITNYLYLGDGSAIFGGYSTPRQDMTSQQSFYFCKIDNFGLPFDPTPVVGKVAGGVAISVYPNPTSGQVQVAGITQATEYEVCTMQGKVLDNGTIQPQGSISLSAYEAGVYFVRINGGVVKVVRE